MTNWVLLTLRQGGQVLALHVYPQSEEGKHQCGLGGECWCGAKPAEEDPFDPRDENAPVIWVHQQVN